ncbi:hypothetical protein EHQ27_06290 [Leptospira wolffii]|uniref:hypothetical protein n=1 Tax=Leptospira wolffii TaxID=409998 RepID=UPI001083F588|nr:hypothetical protein [Leptospira wolffii]TGK55969.1 hypothetical protein EHQ32_16225 [Leptospira wolffii]TGK72015.1 hypothetical protein EHQ35_11660 [Leptospira wolffii]TGK73680.1 hypothetical protein EHQ27_06290 [Leptospira wolffii]TGL27592.1 hypothetical protein EHQ57_14485 [Leptospira wolffii]
MWLFRKFGFSLGSSLNVSFLILLFFSGCIYYSYSDEIPFSSSESDSKKKAVLVFVVQDRLHSLAARTGKTELTDNSELTEWVSRFPKGFLSTLIQKFLYEKFSESKGKEAILKVLRQKYERVQFLPLLDDMDLGELPLPVKEYVYANLDPVQFFLQKRLLSEYFPNSEPEQKEGECLRKFLDQCPADPNRKYGIYEISGWDCIRTLKSSSSLCHDFREVSDLPRFKKESEIALSRFLQENLEADILIFGSSEYTDYFSNFWMRYFAKLHSRFLGIYPSYQSYTWASTLTLFSPKSLSKDTIYNSEIGSWEGLPLLPIFPFFSHWSKESLRSELYKRQFSDYLNRLENESIPSGPEKMPREAEAEDGAKEYIGTATSKNGKPRIFLSRLGKLKEGDLVYAGATKEYPIRITLVDFTYVEGESLSGMEFREVPIYKIPSGYAD